MNRNDVQSGIYNSWKLAEKLGIGRTISTPAPLENNPDFRNAVLDYSKSYSEIYEIDLMLSHYNFSLDDYSYFQFILGEDDVLRYAYYPNPYISHADKGSIQKWQELLDAELIAHEDFMALLRGKDVDLRAPCIRYENAPGQYKVLKHPCSHLHRGHHGDNRWPLKRIITPYAFMLFISKQYYGEKWRYFDSEEDEFGNPLEGELIAEKRNCRILGDDLFAEIEGFSFYFS